MAGEKSLGFIHLIFSFLLLVEAESHVSASQLRTYIVHVQLPEAIASSYDRHGWYKSFLPVRTDSTVESRMLHMYTNIVSGFAARLTEHELAQLATIDGFLDAYPDSLLSIQTTHTPDFLGLHLQQGAWNVSGYGEGVIIGLIDTGIFPNHPSFCGDGMPPPPSRWKGWCEFTNSSVCNNKLIGARNFVAGETSNDNTGHGTHTASTAAGAFVRGAEALGNAEGTAAGMAPRAHLAIYKACAYETCTYSDILAAMDAAVSDGVDVLSISIGGNPRPFYLDGMAVGAFGLMEKGVFVSCAGGNRGPNVSSVLNEAPWILTVAASTIDRSIRSTVRLGNGLELNGESLYQPQNFTPAFFPLVYAAYCANTSLEGIDVRGKIVLCERHGNTAVRIEMGANVKNAGGAGMILMNGVADGYSTLAEAHVLPASHVSYSDGSKIKDFITSSSDPTATFLFKGTLLGTSPAPAIASFSSRGPSQESPGILKPDITGPGVSVLAAWPSFSGGSGPNFNVVSGTSMSTPHLSGIAALIKAAHPDWSPAAIKSAIMTTAYIIDRSGNPIVDERLLPADHFAMGAGHVNPSVAIDPGLVYDLGADEYIPYLCGLGYNNAQVGAITSRRIDCSKVGKISEGDLNYPSISVALGEAAPSVTMERTVKNVGDANSTYRVRVEAPAGVSVVVKPRRLLFSKLYQEQKFSVTFSRKDHSGTGVSHGHLSWVSNRRTVRSPISITFN